MHLQEDVKKEVFICDVQTYQIHLSRLRPDKESHQSFGEIFFTEVLSKSLESSGDTL